jgi:hypothetical protein
MPRANPIPELSIKQLCESNDSLTNTLQMFKRDYRNEIGERAWFFLVCFLRYIAQIHEHLERVHSAIYSLDDGINSLQPPPGPGWNGAKPSGPIIGGHRR